MRASLGLRAGPLYIGTGNLLKPNRPRRQHGVGVVAWLIVALIMIPCVVGITAWHLAAAAWRGSARLANHHNATPDDTLTNEPADDPAWAPRTH